VSAYAVDCEYTCVISRESNPWRMHILVSEMLEVRNDSRALARTQVPPYSLQIGTDGHPDLLPSSLPRGPPQTGTDRPAPILRAQRPRRIWYRCDATGRSSAGSREAGSSSAVAYCARSLSLVLVVAACRPVSSGACGGARRGCPLHAATQDARRRVPSLMAPSSARTRGHLLPCTEIRALTVGP
jgi:hypothetical protein